MAQKHFIITGGAGFIGSQVAASLLREEGVRITCIDNFDPFYQRSIKLSNIEPLLRSPRFSLLQMDLDVVSPAVLSAAIPGSVDAVIHLAAKAGVRPSIQQPQAYIQTNIAGTQTLLDFAVQKGGSRFVFASSSSVYGLNREVPWREDAPLLPVSPYAMTKLAGEAAGHVYHQLYGLPFIALRLFTVYGPRQRPDLAIHRFTQALEGGLPITLYGNGSSSRDYTYIDDVVGGIRAALDYDAAYEVFNLGNNTTVSLRELIEALEAVTGKRALIHYLPDQPGDVPLTCASIAKAQRLLHYQPRTRLEEGLAQFYHWFQSHQGVLAAH